jgi:hypothetical protein
VYLQQRRLLLDVTIGLGVIVVITRGVLVRPKMKPCNLTPLRSRLRLILRVTPEPAGCASSTIHHREPVTY